MVPSYISYILKEKQTYGPPSDMINLLFSLDDHDSIISIAFVIFLLFPFFFFPSFLSFVCFIKRNNVVLCFLFSSLPHQLPPLLMASTGLRIWKPKDDNNVHVSNTHITKYKVGVSSLLILGN